MIHNLTWKTNREAFPREVKILLQEFPTLLEAARRCRKAKTKQEKAHIVLSALMGDKAACGQILTPTLLPAYQAWCEHHTVCRSHQAEELNIRHGSFDPAFRSISSFQSGSSMLFHQAWIIRSHIQVYFSFLVRSSMLF
ncbi:hypothetical protein AVEN_28397-1, partial [Araneus ventricosus]